MGSKCMLHYSGVVRQQARTGTERGPVRLSQTPCRCMTQPSDDFLTQEPIPARLFAETSSNAVAEWSSCASFTPIIAWVLQDAMYETWGADYDDWDTRSTRMTS